MEQLRAAQRRQASRARHQQHSSDQRSRRLASYGGERDEGRLIWQTPETLWQPSRKGPTALVAAQTTWQYLCLLLTFEKVDNFASAKIQIAQPLTSSLAEKIDC